MMKKDSRPTLAPSGTSPWIRFEPPLLPQRGTLDRLLATALPGTTARHIEFLERGVVNSNYRVDLIPASTDQPKQVRLRLTRRPEATGREAALTTRLLAAHPGLVARPLAFESCVEPEAHIASLWTWIEGATLEEMSLDAGAEESLGDELAAALHDVHGETVEGFGRLKADLRVADAPGFDRPALRWLDDLARRIAVRLENPAHGLAPDALSPLKLAVARAMAPLWSVPSTSGSLVHGDLSAGNILVSLQDGRPRLAGLIDWEMCRSADPAVDAASAEFELSTRWPILAKRLSENLRAQTPDNWDRRFDLAAVPLLLDARMVALVRHSAPLTERVDARLAAMATRWSN
ncbi:MAG: aminoglycoside phosphotransferase family protein [Candidatus Eisenbacteria bacterium]|nr:aminoglycoside phosphotransferase family protein [Candidatus Eisenbacteria bacterium]